MHIPTNLLNLRPGPPFKQESLLRLGWPATAWETGPEPEMVEKWPAEWPVAPQAFVRADFRAGDEDESSGSVNGPNLFTELPFL